MEPKFAIFTDVHLKPGNEEEVFGACEEIVTFCSQNYITEVVCLGDVFDSRIAQRQSVLTCWSDCLDLFDSENIMLHCLRGNHDTSVYDREECFLDAYRNRPNFDLIPVTDARDIQGIRCWFLPFYPDETLVSIMEDLKNDKTTKNTFLLGHFSVQGSKNQGTEIESKLSRDLFKSFKKVILGHFHDYQEVSKSITHIGSLFQNNFGETEENKGFWLFYEDGTLENVPLELAPKFKKLSIDLNSTSQKQANTLIERFKENNPSAKLRVELTGDASTVKAFDKSKYQELGIDIKKKYNDIDVPLNEEKEIEKLDEKGIIDKFKQFCEENSYDEKEGLKILNELLKG